MSDKSNKSCKICVWYNSTNIAAPCRACHGRKKHVLKKQEEPELEESYDTLVDRAVESGQSTIFYQGREISIM